MAPAQEASVTPPLAFQRAQVEGLVSVVIPTYRGERFIGRTLESIGQQSYPHWEVLVVEDGPGRETQRIVEEFALRHPRHRVHFNRNDRNYGPSHSRNVAFVQAAGEFVALLDADDVWLPTHLARAVEELQKPGRDVVYSTVVMFEDETEMLLGLWGPEHSDLRDFAHRLFLRNFVTPSATVLKRQVLADVGSWETNLRYCEDLSFWLRCVAAGKSFHYIGGCHCLYRKNHAGAATARMCETLESFANVVERYIQLPGLRERTCRRFAAKAYLRAAEYHRHGNPQYDPSADASRAPLLLRKARQLRPKRIDYLLKAAWLDLGLQWRRLKRSATPGTPATPQPAAESLKKRQAA